jgi:hypothetical protein
MEILPRREHLVRTAALGGALVTSIIIWAVSGGEAGTGPEERPFELEGWEYDPILPAGAPGRYRLRIEVAPVSTPVPAPASAAAGTEGPPAETRGPSEFRLLLERADDANFVCLRWIEGELELVRIAGGERAGLVGRTSYPLPCIAPRERAPEIPAVMRTDTGAATTAAGPAPEAFVIDRSAGLWTVTHRGRELIVAGDPGPPAIETVAVADTSTDADAEANAGAEADADTAAGAHGGGDFAWGSGPDWRLASRALQPVEDIHLEDGFAKVKFNEDGTYDVRSGRWDLDAVAHASRSVNAFRLRGRSASKEDGGEPGVVLFGRSFWRRYRASAAIRFRRPGAGGIIFAAQRARPPRTPHARVVLLKEGEKEGRKKPEARPAEAMPLARYGLLRWHFPDGIHGQPGRLEVVDVRVFPAPRGRRTRREATLLSLPWTPRRDQWHRVAVSLFDELGQVEVNGARAVFRLPAGLRAGECGVYADSASGVLFDDIRAASHEGFLHRTGALAEPWAPSAVPGADGAAGASVYRLPEGPAWLRMAFREGAPGASVSWRDAGGGVVSVALDRASGRGEVTRRAPGAEATEPELLAEFDTTPGAKSDANPDAHSDNGPGLELGLQLDENTCTVLRGLTALATVPLGAARVGPVSIASPETLRELAGGPLSPPPALRHKAGSFAEVDVRMHPEGMHPEHKWVGFVGWMKDESSWVRGPEGSLSCETLLWGACEASVEAALPRKDGVTVELRFAVDRAGTPGAAEADGKPDGHVVDAIGVALRRAPGGYVILDANGSERGAFTPPAFPDEKPAEKVTLTLRRAGDRVESLVAGERVFVTRLAAREAVRVEARAPGLLPEAIAIRSRTVDESLFESAPEEWTRWRGHWDVTTKWQCDPRWTFLGIWSDALEKKSDAAGAFTRHSYLGDQDLRMYFAFRDVLNNKHDDGRRYVRRDLNFAFGCTDEDPASGYCLMIGGYDNRGTQLLRRGRLVHEVREFRIPTFNSSSGSGDIHWRWFCLRILNRGGRITATVNGKEVLAWTDPEPLGGGHVGLWTLGGGMILGRTRFSAERRGKELCGFSTTVAPPPVRGWWPVDEDHAARVTPSEAEALARAKTPDAKTPDARAPDAGASDADASHVKKHGRPARVVRVTNLAAGGHFGVAHSIGGNGSTPAAIAFRAEPGVRVRAYAMPASAVRPGKAFGHSRTPRRLLPSDGKPLPADGTWHVLSIKEALQKGDALVIGNWESDGYAAAGIGANGPRASYEAGVFTRRGEAERFVRRVEEGAVLSVMPPNPRAPVADPSREAMENGPARALAVAGGWEPLDWGNAAKVSVHERPDGVGEFMLLRSAAGKHGKTVVRLESAMSLPSEGTFRLDVWNATEREVPVAFAVWSGSEYVYSESRLRSALPKRWSRIEFDLAARDFKSADSCWKHTTALRGPGSVREVALLFYGNAAGAVAVENIEVDERPPSAVPPAVPALASASAPAPSRARSAKPRPRPPETSTRAPAKPKKERVAASTVRRPAPKPKPVVRTTPKPKPKPVPPKPKPKPKPRRRREDPGGPF